MCDSSEEKRRVDSQVKILVRPLYSNPPVHGARIASKILDDPDLQKQWLEEVKGMAERIITMRALLKRNLEDLGSKRDWSHITSQVQYPNLWISSIANLYRLVCLRTPG